MGLGLGLGLGLSLGLGLGLGLGLAPRTWWLRVAGGPAVRSSAVHAGRLWLREFGAERGVPHDLGHGTPAARLRAVCARRQAEKLALEAWAGWRR